MRSFQVLAAAAFATLVAADAATTSSLPPHAVVSAVAPNQSPPPGCSPNYDGGFEIAPVNYSSVNGNQQRDLEPRDTKLYITLKNGVLTDTAGRTGYIASNNQFQFDDPPQAGAIWTAGFSICKNTSMALGSDLIWYRCLSGGFGNLYNANIGSVCIKSYIIARPVNGGHPAPVPASLSTASFATASGSAVVNGTVVTSLTHHNATATGSSSSSKGVSPGHATTKKTTATSAKKQTNTAASSTGSASMSASSSSTSSGFAAETNHAGSAFFGLAGGLLGLAAMI